MGPLNGVNLERVKYFELQEYIDRISISDDIMHHVEDTSKNFEKYIKFLSAYNYPVILEHLINSFTEEMKYSNKVEHHLLRPEDLDKNNVYFDSLSMNHHRIKELHRFVQEGQENFRYEYRESEVRVSYIDKEGQEHIYWYGAESEDIEKFLDSFIKIYKTKGIQVILSNPFLKAALCHLLFVRIHPFTDGNGRTARLIYDMKFTEMINMLYGTKLKISPLHLSMSIYVNQPTYVKKIDNIYFDIEHDSNDEINQFFDFILNMTDEQIHYMMTDDSKTKLDQIATMYENGYAANLPLDIETKKEADDMKLKKLLQYKLFLICSYSFINTLYIRTRYYVLIILAVINI